MSGVQVTPLDVVKCNMQTDPVKYPSIGKGFGITVREQGYSGLVRGWFPTLIGYSIQGAGKFGLYEYFKKCVSAFATIAFQPAVMNLQILRRPLLLAGAGSQLHLHATVR